MPNDIYLLGWLLSETDILVIHFHHVIIANLEVEICIFSILERNQRNIFRFQNKHVKQWICFILSLDQKTHRPSSLRESDIVSRLNYHIHQNIHNSLSRIMYITLTESCSDSTFLQDIFQLVENV